MERVHDAYRELEAAHEAWTRKIDRARSSLRYEDLLPVALDADEAFRRFMKASRAVTGALNCVATRAGS